MRKFENRIQLVALATLAAFLLLVSQAMAGPYDKLLFFPEREFYTNPQDLDGFKTEDVYFKTEDDLKIHGWYFENPNSKGTVIVSHGNAGNISYRIPLIKMLLKLNLSVLAYDYRGYGKSKGTPTIDGVCLDGLAAYNYLLTERKLEATKIILYGESLGGGITCHIASRKQCGAIILQSTFSSLPNVARKVMPVFWAVPKVLMPKNTMDNMRVCSQEHPPLLIVHGTDDEVIPYSEALKLNSKAIEPKVFSPIKNAGHNNIYPTYSGDLKRAIKEFLEAQTKLLIETPADCSEEEFF